MEHTSYCIWNDHTTTIGLLEQTNSSIDSCSVRVHTHTNSHWTLPESQMNDSTLQIQHAGVYGQFLQIYISTLARSLSLSLPLTRQHMHPPANSNAPCSISRSIRPVPCMTVVHRPTRFIQSVNAAMQPSSAIHRRVTRCNTNERTDGYHSVHNKHDFCTHSTL